MVKWGCFFDIKINYLELFLAWISFSVTSVHVKKGKWYILKIVSILVLSIEAYNMVKWGCFFDYYYYLEFFLAGITFTYHLFMLGKVNDTYSRYFLGLYCLSKLIILLDHDAFMISLLFRFVSRLNHFQLPLFMLKRWMIYFKDSF